MVKIVTDSTADLPAEYLQEHDLGCINLSYIMDGVTYGQGQELPEKEFYALMRNGTKRFSLRVDMMIAKNDVPEKRGRSEPQKALLRESFFILA